MQQAPISKLNKLYREFAALHPEVEDDFSEAIEDVLADAGLTFDRVSVRLKRWQSFKAKAKKRTADGELMYPNPWTDIHDLMGVRITTFHSTEIPQIVDALDDVFKIIRSVDKAQETRVSGGFGYGSLHLILEVDERTPELDEYVGFQFEVQIRTVLQHAWAEFEHDIRYKRSQGRLDPRVDRAFTLAAGLIELADQQFDMIAAIQEPHPEDDDEITITPETLPGIIAMLAGNQFPQSRTEDYAFLHELLNAHDITKAETLRMILNSEDIEFIRKAFNYRFPPGQVRIVDDLLLHRYRGAHIGKTKRLGTRSRQRPYKLKRRLEQIVKAEEQRL